MVRGGDAPVSERVIQTRPSGNTVPENSHRSSLRLKYSADFSRFDVPRGEHPETPMKHPILFCASCFAVTSLTQLAHATDYYVASNGTQNAAGTLAAPFTVNKAASTAKAGDTVYLRGGTYTGSLNPLNSGTASAWITFSAYPGELPIFEGKGTGGTGIGSSTAQFVRYVGLVARNYSSGGFANGWTGSDCATMSNGNVQIIDCVADGNGINGMAFYCASNVLIDESIVLHNGNTPPSWSSGVNLFHVYGDYTTNIVQRTVSFENIDVCGQANCTAPTGKSSDGSGFILDQNSTGALFANNIGFRNGGSCIRLTNSSGAHLVNNTCYHDGLQPADAQSQPSKPGEIFFSDATSKNGATFFNNLGAASGYNNDQTAFAGQVPAGQSNFAVNSNAATPFFTDPAGTNPNFRLTSAAQTSIVDKGVTTNAPATDIGFDPKCLTKAASTTTGAPAFWQYQVDYAYITSVGGVSGCFKPSARSGAPDIGAYELTGTSSGCSSAADCNDSDVCTSDACTDGACSHSALGGCCKSTTDCNDSDVCTTDTCSTTTNQCTHASVAGCCKSAADCNDANACTTDTCNTQSGQCGHASIAGCCASASDCNDTNPCTSDTCNTTTHTCGHAGVSGCCQQDSACNDGNACSADSCNLTQHQCTSQPISSCCNADADCAATSSCVQTSCNLATHACVSAVIANCCTSNAGCNDQNPCTSDTCNTQSGVCTNALISACCQLDGDCNDQNPCTSDSCNLGSHTCAHASNPSCCTLDTQCTDGDGCTLDSCNLNLNACAHAPDPACNAAGAGGTSAGGMSAGGMSAGGSDAGGGAAGNGGAPNAAGGAGGVNGGGMAGTSGMGGGAGSALGGTSASAGVAGLGVAGTPSGQSGASGAVSTAPTPEGPAPAGPGSGGSNADPSCACSLPSERQGSPWNSLAGLVVCAAVGWRRRKSASRRRAKPSLPLFFPSERSNRRATATHASRGEQDE